MPSFYNGKRFFLTFARCRDSAEDLVKFLQSRANVSYFLVANELHEDGTPHLHACIEFDSVQRHDKDWLNFNGKHPNKQDPRKWEACKQYCKKDGKFIEGPEDYVLRECLRTMAPSEIAKTFDEKPKWFDYCVQNKIAYSFAKDFWEWSRNDQFTIQADDETQGKICKSLDSLEFCRDKFKTLVLCGESGCGKTTWAKRNAPRPALFVSHIDTLKKFDTEVHKSIIFDDVDFNHYPRTSQIHLVDFDNPRAIHVRYGCVEIPAGIFKIFTCNSHPLTLTDAAIRRRVQVYNVK